MSKNIEHYRNTLGSDRKLIFIAASHSIEMITYYLACLRSGHPVFLFSNENPEIILNIISHYNPHVIINPDESDNPVVVRHTEKIELHEDLSLLLSTSGSTGTPKLVKLSKENINSNANSIATYLNIDNKDRVLAHLKLHYSYGLSILHSHLAVGASIFLTSSSVIDSLFWETIKKHKITSFAGVPYTFTSIDTLAVDFGKYPTLRYITQAGGKMQHNDVKRWVRTCNESRIEFVVMYGQTEASPRIAYLPTSKAMKYPEAIGIAIPGGKINIYDENEYIINQPHVAGELVYEGPNVMMGYAENIQDLAKEKTVFKLKTGDIAIFNQDNIFTIVGRKSRFVKPFGIRVSLDDIQADFSHVVTEGYCTGNDENIILAYKTDKSGVEQNILDFIQDYAKKSHIPLTLFHPLKLEEVPLLSSGKIDYSAILRLSEKPDSRSSYTKLFLKNISLPFTKNFISSYLKEIFTILGFVKRDLDLASIYATFLNVEKIQPNDTFKTLGGDSLSYVALSIEVERMCGSLPHNWEDMSIQDLNEYPKKAERL